MITAILFLTLRIVRNLLIQSFQLLLHGSQKGSPSGMGAEGRHWGSCEQIAWWVTTSSYCSFWYFKCIKWGVPYYLESTSAASHSVQLPLVGKGSWNCYWSLYSRCQRNMPPTTRCNPLTVRGQGSREGVPRGPAPGLTICIHLYWMLLIICVWCALQGDCLIVHVCLSEIKHDFNFEIFLMGKSLVLKFILKFSALHMSKNIYHNTLNFIFCT